jgi:hypothetical protein
MYIKARGRRGGQPGRMSISFERMIRITALAACGLVGAMVAIFFATGVGQDPLQFVHPPGDYAQLLLANPPALRATIALDNVFLALYTTMFVALACVLIERGGHRGFVRFVIGLLIANGLLDLVENLHFLVMLSRAELGIVPSADEIGLQVMESLVKFHVSYLGLLALGFALPRHTAAQRWLANLSFVQLPIGILVYVTPARVSLVLVFARFSYFVVAFVLVAVGFGRAGSGAPVSRRDTTPGGAG